MATQNATINKDWVLIAGTGDDTVLIQAARPGVKYEIAASSTATAPTVYGHYIQGRGMAITRELVGPGYIYARLISNSFNNNAVLIVSGSSETLS